MKAKLLFDSIGDAGKDPVTGKHRTKPLPAGTVIEHPQAYVLVQNGQAAPADDECRQRAGMSAEQLATAQVHYDMVSKGIQPEDYEAYQAGAMTGYDSGNNWIPGPNYEEWLTAHGLLEDDQPDDES